MRHVFTFERVVEGTRMTQVAEIKPNVVGWILRLAMSRVVQGRFRTISDAIAGYLDAKERNGAVRTRSTAASQVTTGL